MGRGGWDGGVTDSLVEPSPREGSSSDGDDLREGMRKRETRSPSVSTLLESLRATFASVRAATPNKPPSPQPPLQPPSHIFMVPLGPKLVRSTSCSPRAAHILTAKAAWARATSALEFIAFIADITRKRKEPCNRQKQPEPRFQGQPRRHGSRSETSANPRPDRT